MPFSSIAGRLNHLRRRAQSRLTAGFPAREERYGPHPRHRLLTWSPRDPIAPPPRILLIHGGGFQARGPEDFISLGPAFARAGWRASAMAYRFGDVPAAADDALRAVDALSDPAAPILATWGYSAGALLSVLAALGRPAQVGACVAVACPGDLTDFPFLEPLCPPGDRVRLSPALLPSAASPPILLVQGDLDPIVPLAQAQQIAARHPSVTLRRVPRGDHTLRWPPLASALTRREMRRWLEARRRDAVHSRP